MSDNTDNKRLVFMRSHPHLRVQFGIPLFPVLSLEVLASQAQRSAMQSAMSWRTGGSSRPSELRMGEERPTITSWPANSSRCASKIDVFHRWRR